MRVTKRFPWFCVLMIALWVQPGLASRPETPISVEIDISHAPGVNDPAKVNITVTSIIDAPGTQVELVLPGGATASATTWNVDLLANIPANFSSTITLAEHGNATVSVRAVKAFASGTVWGDMKSIPLFVGGLGRGPSERRWKADYVPVARLAKQGNTAPVSMDPTPLSFGPPKGGPTSPQVVPSVVPVRVSSPAPPAPSSPGTVTLTGRFQYEDRSGVARDIDQQLIEIKSGDGSAHVYYCYTDPSGYLYSCSFTHPGTTMRVWLRSYAHYAYSGGSDRLGVFSGPEVSGGCGSDAVDCAYAVQTGEISCPDGATCDVGTWLVNSADWGEPWLGANQMTQDLIRSWKKMYNDSTYGTAGPGRINYPVPYGHGTHTHVPGTDPWISIEPPSQQSADVVVSEYGHAMMANLWALFTPNWPTSDCPSPHYVHLASGPGCALSQGFAEFWAWYSNELYDGDSTAANDGPVFDWPGGASTNLETRDGGTYDPGDQVEGNVAAVFGDMFDYANDGPAQGPADRLSDGLQPIWDTTSSQSDYNFSEWWQAYLDLGHSQCPALDVLWYNGIEYPPGCVAPPNDNWANAAVVDSLPYTSIVDTTQATTELTDPYPGCGNNSTANSVWYVFTPTFNGTVTANTFGSNYDTILSAFTGGPGAFGWQACNDDSSGFQSQISFGVTAGVTYSFMATSYGGGGGSLVFNLSFIPAGPYVSLSPTTLNFGNQVVNTTSPPLTVTLTNVGTADLVVYGMSLAGSMPGDFAIVSDGCTSAYVVPGAFCTFGVTFTPTAAGLRTANVSISDNAPDTPQTVSLGGTGLAGPPNDNWANAAVISGVPYTNTVDTTQATTEGTDPSPGCGNSSTAKSVWYVFTPTQDGTVTANTIGSNYDTILSAFTGTPGAFSLQACNDDYSGLQSQVSFGVTAGVAYSFMATSYGSGGGSLVFNLSFMPTAPYVSLSPTAVDFGDQVVNTTSAAQTVTVTNVGNTDLAISGVSLTGLIPEDFMIVSDTCSGAYVVPSGFCTLGVTFTPGDTGSRTAQINISDNAPDTPQTVPLQGMGIVQPPELTWLSPWSAAPGGPEFTLTVNGSSFTSNSVVRWNGSDRVTTFLSDTQLQATIPASDIAVEGSAQVTVYTPDAGTSKILTFAIEFNTLFRADFEAGTQGFAASTVINTLTWQRTTNRGADVGHSPTTSFYFGNPSTFNYQTYLREGAVLTSPPISLGAAPLALGFNYFLATENMDYWDIAEVQVSNDGGYIFNPLISNRSSSVLVDNTGSWLSATADLSSYAGQTVVLRFSFDTVDSGINNYEGWYVDDVVVQSSGPSVQLSPTSLGFGNQLIYTTSAPLTETVTNTGAATLTISGVSLTGTNPGDFAKTGDTCTGANVAPANSCTITVTFTPTTTGARSATLSISDNASGSPQTVTLSGTGTGGPAVGLSPASLNFGNQLKNTTSAPLTETVTNTGAATLTISGVSLTGANPGDFAKTGDTCTGANVAPANSCTITVTFTPTTTGARSASLSITDNAPGSPHTVPLTGTGTAPTVGLSPASLNFGNQLKNTTSSPRTETVTNTGTGTLTISGVSLTGTNPGDFAKTGDTCTGANVAPANSCTITITFTPTATGARSATLSISDSASGSPHTVPLTGTGTAPTVGLSPASLNFANQLKNTTSAPLTETVTNTGTGTLTISGVSLTGTNPGDFAKAGDTCTGANVAPANSCTITVTFTPTAVGARTANLAITDSATGSPHTVPLSGTGTSPAVTLSPPSLNFGNQVVGTASAPQPVTLTNSGTAPLTISSITASGDYAQTNNCASPLAAAASCTINVTFTPTVGGTRTGAITVTDNAAGSPHLVSLSGTGTAPPGVTFSPTGLSFGNQALATTSAPKPVTLTNSGQGPLTINSITTSGNFAQTNNCVSPLAAAASCTINVTFTTTVVGGQSGTLNMVDNAVGSPHTVGLGGVGVGPVATLSATSLNFGNQAVGTTSAPKLVNLSNTGNAAMTITSIVASGDFAQTNNCVSPLAARTYCTISVTFSPTASGTRTGPITIVDNAAGSPHAVALSGTGTVPVVSFSPTSLSFGNQTRGTTSAPKAVTLTNSGLAPLTISSINTSGNFAQTNNCVSPLAVAAACTINVTFTPTVVGGQSGALTVIDNAPGSPHTAALSGVGLGPLAILSPTSLSLGNQVVGTTSAAKPVILSNSGNAPLTITSIVASGDYAQTNNCVSSLAAHTYCTINVTFTPTVGGARTGAITVTDNAAGSPHLVSLSGTGTAPPGVTFSPTGLSFGNQALATTSAPKPVTLTNSGLGPLTINSITTSGNFAQTNNCVSPLAAAASCTINVTFTPTVVGGQSGTLNMVDNAVGSPHTVGLGGVGVGPLAALSATSLNFGNQALGITSAPKLVNLSNTGNAALTISSIVASGDYAQTNNCVSPLAAHTYCTINVTFTPTASGTRTGATSITDNAAGSPHTVALTGIGVGSLVSLAPTSLSLGNQALATTSTPKPVTLTNSGLAPLTITSIGTTGNFAQTNNCVSPLAVAASCTINVTFTPTVVGGQSGALTVIDNAPGSPHTAALSGVGLGPLASLSPTSLSFGNQVVGTTSAAKPVILSNSGNAALTITSIVASGDYAQTNNCVSSLAAHTYCTISVTFTPTVGGTRTGAITVTDNAAGSPHLVSLSGTGAVPAVSLSPTSLSFGNQTRGTTSAPKPVMLTNSGQGPLTINSITTSGNYAQTNNCVSPLAAAASCTINVTFTPTVVGGQSGTLTIVDNAAGSPHTVALNGVGVGPVATLSATSLNFGNQASGITSAPKSLDLSNSGNAPLTISSITISGNYAQTNNCVSPLAASAYCTINITFTPTGVGGRGGTLTIVDSAPGSPRTVALTGTGVGPLAALSPVSLAFGSLGAGATSAPKAVILSNSGNASLTISSITTSGDYARTSNCASSLAAHTYCTINVTFAPTASGTRSGALTVTDNAAGSPQSVTLTGNGLGPAVTLSPTSLTFGSLGVGVPSSPQTVTLTNNGAGVLTIRSITPSGDFAQSNNCVSPVAAGGGFCTISVTFTPTAGGTRNGTISIADDAPGNPHTVTLTGTGLGPAVTLSPTSLNFGEQNYLTTSSPRPVTLTNSGAGPLTISSITTSGDYGKTHDCPGSLAAGAFCTINVTFTPTGLNTRTGTLTIVDNAPGSPHTAPLTGIGKLTKG